MSLNIAFLVFLFQFLMLYFRFLILLFFIYSKNLYLIYSVDRSLKSIKVHFNFLIKFHAFIGQFFLLPILYFKLLFIDFNWYLIFKSFNIIQNLKSIF